MSCLFNSLSYFLNENSFQIRQKICDYLQENKPIIDGLETNDVLKFVDNNNCNNYISNMRLVTTWGGAVEIQSACNIWNLRINVSNFRNQNEQDNKIIEFIPIKEKYEKTIDIYWTGGHFEPLRK